MKVLIATDGHEAAKNAIASAARLLPLTAAEVRLVSVMDPEERIGGNTDAKSDLASGCAQLSALGVTAVPVERRGRCAEEIVAEAQGWGADVVVLGTSGRGRLGQWFTGSVSDAVIHSWKGALLLINRG